MAEDLNIMFQNILKRSETVFEANTYLIRHTKKEAVSKVDF